MWKVWGRSGEYRILVAKPERKERDQLEDLGVDERIILM
jgi:hypothetical protein